MNIALISLSIASDWGDILKALSDLLNALVAIFGARLTATFIIIGFLSGLGFRILANRRKERIDKRLETEKERTIERLSADNVSLRVLVFKQIHGWTDDEIERFIIQNRFNDGIDVGHALTGEHIARKAL